jgi:ATP-dependent Lon protease
MSRGTTGRETDSTPAGFERVALGQGTTLLLPSRAAVDFRERAQRRAQSERDVRDKEDERRRALPTQSISPEQIEEAEKQREKLRNLRVLRRTKPKPGWHRVLPQLAEIAKELADTKAVERTPDKDVNERRRRTLERLVELGPDRRVALPPAWRAAVDDLEATLPHFRAPIRALRHALALAESTGTPPRIAPQLLLGPPGFGKTFFTHRVAKMFGSTHAAIQFDQPNAGSGLRGSDKHWANTESGLLFNAICLGEVANPVILLDEMDKAASGSGRLELDPLAQLHGVLERETAQRLLDVSVDVTFDASLAIYVGTANSLRGIGAPLVSRMEVFAIEPPDKWAAIDLATSIARSVLQGLGLEGRVMFNHPSLCLLSHLSPRRMTRVAEQAVAAAVAAGRQRIGEDDLWRELDGAQASAMH